MQPMTGSHTLPPSQSAACHGQSSWAWSIAATVVAALLLAGCAGGPQEFQSHPPSESEARQLFAEAYSHIQQRYIEPVAIAPLALNGMQGLVTAQQDRDLRLQDDTDTLRVLKRNTTVASFRRPDPHDADGWAEVTAGLLHRIHETAPEPHVTPAEDIYETVLDGVVEPLDPFSRYATARAAEQQRGAREGFDGIGITIRTKDGETHVNGVMPGTPADAGGLMVGDRITHVDGKPLAGLELEQVVEHLRGPAGSVVLLTLLRPEPPEPLQVKLRRTHVVPETVHAAMEDSLALFRISSFNRNTTRELERKYRQLAKHRIRGMIVDLRGNPGGLLDQAVLVADLFLDGGVIISTRGRHPASSSIFTADLHQIGQGVPMALLINGDSASAAELMAAALLDRGRAVAVGTTTHGKGTVQNLSRLPNGGELIITWSRIHAPSGYILDGLGVLPSICTADKTSLDSATAVSARLDAYALHSARWHRYDHVDPSLAATLRNDCPARADQPDSDIAIAKHLLRNPVLYARALQPVLESASTPVLAGLGTS